MNKKLLGYGLLLVLFAGCTSSKDQVKNRQVSNEFRKTITAGTSQMTVEIKPAATIDSEELVFQTQFTLPKDQLEQDKELALRLQYNVDSSFYLLGAKDTLWPLYVLPVANGQPCNPQYLVAFDKGILDNSAAIDFRTHLKNLDITDQPGLVFNSKKIKSLHN